MQFFMHIGRPMHVLLADGALDMINPEARRVLYLIAETGLRLSEACNLTAETIHLDAPVPHVQVRPDGRRMKTEQSERDIRAAIVGGFREEGVPV